MLLIRFVLDLLIKVVLDSFQRFLKSWLLHIHKKEDIN